MDNNNNAPVVDPNFSDTAATQQVTQEAVQEIQDNQDLIAMVIKEHPVNAVSNEVVAQTQQPGFSEQILPGIGSWGLPTPGPTQQTVIKMSSNGEETKFIFAAGKGPQVISGATQQSANSAAQPAKPWYKQPWVIAVAVIVLMLFLVSFILKQQSKGG